MGAAEFPDEKATCRICWEHANVKSEMLSPCKCSGTQKHVHLKCLRRWQENVQRRDAADERAFRCGVCRALFSVPPPKARGSGALWLQLLRGLGGMLCISLLAFGLSGPPWPHLALLVLLLLGSRSHWLPGLGLLSVVTLLATLHARGLRVILRVDDGGRLGLAVIRHGAPVQGVGPGVLLVASDGLAHSVFRKSVVLLTEHGRGGARGVIISQPMAHPPTLPAGLAGAGGTGVNSTTGGGAASQGRTAGKGASRSSGEVVLKHYLGGPVGMPGEGVRHEITVLHPLPGVAGARRLLPQTHRASHTVGGGGDVEAMPPHGAAPGPRTGTILYEGGSLGEVLERATDAAAAAAAAAAASAVEEPQPQLDNSQKQAAAAASGSGDEEAPVMEMPPAEAVALPPPVLLFHGTCVWAEGQLEGELRAGAWGFLYDQDVLHLLSLPPDQLWQALADSPALVNMR